MSRGTKNLSSFSMPMDHCFNCAAAEIYEAYGSAMAESMLLEYHLALALLASQIDEKKPKTREELTALSDAAFKMTMGQVVYALQKRGLATPSQVERLTKAKEARNRLAHDYFRVYGLVINLPHAQLRMKRELDAMERESVELRLEWAGKNKQWERRKNLGPSEEQVEQTMARSQAKNEKDDDRSQLILQTILEHQETNAHSRDLIGWIAVWNHRRALDELGERLENG